MDNGGLETLVCIVCGDAVPNLLECDGVPQVTPQGKMYSIVYLTFIVVIGSMYAGALVGHDVLCIPPSAESLRLRRRMRHVTLCQHAHVSREESERGDHNLIHTGAGRIVDGDAALQSLADRGAGPDLGSSMGLGSNRTVKCLLIMILLSSSFVHWWLVIRIPFGLDRPGSVRSHYES